MATAPSSSRPWGEAVLPRLISAILACGILAGCGSAPRENVAANTVANEALAAPEGPAPVETRVKALPASFVGRWGMVPNDCDPSRDDAKGLMEISPEILRFYESRGTVKSVTIASPEKVTADVAFSGEGQTWEKAVTLILANKGETLVREESETPAPLRYQRCPA